MLFFFLFRAVQALYEDQAGVLDWYQQFIGGVERVVTSSFATRGSSSAPRTGEDWALVTTDAGVLAGVKIADGAIDWRQVLPDAEQIDFAAASPHSVAVVSGGGAILRLFGLDGMLLFESNSSSVGPEVAHLSHRLRKLRPTRQPVSGVDVIFLERKDKNPDVAVLANNVVTIHDGTVGTVLWSTNLEGSCEQMISSNVGEWEEIWTEKKSKEKRKESNSASSSEQEVSKKPKSEKSEEAPPNGKSKSAGAADSSEKSKSAAEKKAEKARKAQEAKAARQQQLDSFPGRLHVACNKQGVLNVYTLHAATGSVLSEAQYGSVTARILALSAWFVGLDSNVLQIINPNTKETARSKLDSPALLHDIGMASAFGLSAGSTSVVYLIAANPLSLTPIYTGVNVDFSTGWGANSFTLSSQGARTWVAAATINNAQLAVKHNTTLSGVAPRGGLTKVFAHSDETGLRILSVGKDRSLAYQHAKSSWLRQEALASVTQTEFVDFPRNFVQSDGYPGFFQRLKPYVTSFVKTSASMVVSIASKLRIDLSKYLSVEEEEFLSLHKIAIFLTEPGRVVGMDTRNGSIIWSIFPSLQLPQPTLAKYRLILLRSDLALLVQSLPKDSLSEVTLHYFNPVTGKTLNSNKLPYLVWDMMEVPLRDAEHTKLTLFVDQARQAHLEPASESSRALLAQYYPLLTLYQLKVEAGVVNGYSFHAQNGVISVAPSWTIVFPKGEKISDVALHQAGEVVQSTLRVGGSAGFRYKYLNPNLLALATVRPLSSGVAVGLLKTELQDPSVCIYLIDLATGAVLEKIVHHAATGPVHLVQTENALVYHYWNSEAYEYEISVVELYEDASASPIAGLPPQPTNPLARPPFLPSSFPNSTEVFSARLLPPPVIVQQTYRFRSGVRCLGVTATRKGITTKDIIVGLSGSQVLSVSRNLLDAQRPLNPTNQDRENGIVGYQTDIPITPVSVFSHYHKVARLHGLRSTGVPLESTSFVVSWGLDLLFSQLTPSTTYDLLNQDFNYPFLLGTVGLVFFPIILAQRAARRTDLAEAWK